MATENTKRKFGLLLLALFVVCGNCLAQTTITKSGTAVEPAHRIWNNPQRLTKSPSPLWDASAGTYLIVTPTDLMPLLKTFINWKSQQGFNVETMIMETSEGDSIRQKLIARYHSSTPLTPAQKYVLLIGDVDKLEAITGKHKPSGLNTHRTDLYYGEYTGDYIPEALVGRLAVRDSTELKIELEKIISYEKGLFARSKNILLAAGHEQRSSAPISTNGQVNYLSKMMADSIERADTICFRNIEGDTCADSLRAALGTALSLVNYTGHCLRTGWNNPSVTQATFDSISNPIPTVFVNNCCLSNAFNGDCFGEQLMRMPIGGAVASLGATNETLWDEDYYWAIGAKYPLTINPTYDDDTPGAFDQLWQGGQYDYDNVSIGALNYAGCSAVSMAGSPYDAFYWEIYNLLGDPSMTLFLDAPDTLFISMADTIYAGASTIRVNTLPYARVSATQDERLRGTALADATGLAEVHLKQMLMGDSITLTAYRPGDIYAQRVIPIEVPTGGMIAAEVAVNNSGSSITFFLHHVGNTVPLGEKLFFYQDSLDISLGAQMRRSISYDIPHLANGECDTLSIDTLHLEWGKYPYLAAHLAMIHQGDTYAVQPIMAPLMDKSPKLQQLRIGDNTKNLKPAEPFVLEVTLSNEADSVCSAISNPTTDNQVTYLLPIVASDSPIGTQIDFSPHLGKWSKDYSGWIIHHQAIEDWESGDWTNYPWGTGDAWPWMMDNTKAHTGLFSVRSHPIHDNQRSILTLSITTLTDDSISFYLQVDSQSGDWLYFYVDGINRGRWNGGTDWMRYARLIPAGKHLLQWVYQKDASGAASDDCARIDDIRLPLAWWDRPCGANVIDSSNTVGVATIDPTPIALDIHPVPAREKIIITSEPDNKNRWITIYDNYGRCLEKIIFPKNCQSIQYSTSNLRLGIYTVTLKSDYGCKSQKIIVTR